MAEVKTSAQVRMLKIQTMPEQAQAAKLLADELAKRAALLKLTKLTGKLDSIISKKEV